MSNTARGMKALREPPPLRRGTAGVGRLSGFSVIFSSLPSNFRSSSTLDEAIAAPGVFFSHLRRGK